MQANSRRDRRIFLEDCIAEKVIPNSTAKLLKNYNHPFPPAVEKYLKSNAQLLKSEEDFIFEKSREVWPRLKNHLDEFQIAQMKTDLTTINENQVNRLRQKLFLLCSNSPWAHFGRHNMVKNLSTASLTEAESEALSFGLKFATGLNNKSITDTLGKNYRKNDTDFDKGFIQGIIAAMITQNDEPTIPRRYIIALKNLAKNRDIVISPSDKGSGIVIMDTIQCNDKMLNILKDRNTYSEVSESEEIYRPIRLPKPSVKSSIMGNQNG